MAKAKKTTEKGDFAIVETGGKQYIVSAGETFKTEIFKDKKEGDKVTLDKVVLTSKGGKVEVGAPYLSGESIKGTISKMGKGKKVEVVKYKAKSRYYKMRGHRQPFVDIKIESI